MKLSFCVHVFSMCYFIVMPACKILVTPNIPPDIQTPGYKAFAGLI